MTIWTGIKEHGLMSRIIRVGYSHVQWNSPVLINQTVAREILEHFPIQDLPLRPADKDDQDERVNRLKQVQSNLVTQRPVPVQDDEEYESMNRPGELYRRYRTVEELPDNAKAFYKVAGTFRLND